MYTYCRWWLTSSGLNTVHQFSKVARHPTELKPIHVMHGVNRSFEVLNKTYYSTLRIQDETDGGSAHGKLLGNCELAWRGNLFSGDIEARGQHIVEVDEIVVAIGEFHDGGGAQEFLLL